MKSDSQKTPEVRLTRTFSDAFRRFQDQIREKAYHLSQRRTPGQEDAMADWLEAQAELSSPVQLELKEQKKNFVVEGKLDGFSRDNIEVEITDTELQVFASHSESHKRKKSEGGGTTAEKHCFFQSIALPAAVDIDECDAKLFKNGKLKIRLPKQGKKKSR